MSFIQMKKNILVINIIRNLEDEQQVKAASVLMHCFIWNLSTTYRLWDKKSRKEIPQGVKCRRDDGSQVLRRCETNSHHAVKSKVGESEEHEHQK